MLLLFDTPSGLAFTAQETCPLMVARNTSYVRSLSAEQLPDVARDFASSDSAFGRLGACAEERCISV